MAWMRAPDRRAHCGYRPHKICGFRWRDLWDTWQNGSVPAAAFSARLDMGPGKPPDGWHIGGRPFRGPASLMDTLGRSASIVETIDGHPTTRPDLAKAAPVTCS